MQIMSGLLRNILSTMMKFGIPQLAHTSDEKLLIG